MGTRGERGNASKLITRMKMVHGLKIKPINL